MLRSCGTQPTPAAARRYGRIAVRSRPASSILPPWCRVIPTIVLRRVVLPVPLRPSTASDSPSTRRRSMWEMMTASPYPADTSRSASSSRIEALPAVDGAHPRLRRDLLRGAFGEESAVHENRDATGEAEYQVHVVLDEQHGNFARKSGERGVQLVSLRLRHAGCRLGPKGGGRTGRKGGRDLQEARR